MSRRSASAPRSAQQLRQFFDRYDLLLSPTMPIPAAYADPRDDDAAEPGQFHGLDALYLRRST